MRKALFALSVLAGISVGLQAQSTQTAGQQSGATASTPGGGKQSWAGVLMDASCSVIASNARAGMPGAATASAGNTSTLNRATTATDVSPARSTSEAGAQSARDTASTATTASTGNPAGERSRTESIDPATSSSFTTVREKYRDCMVKPTTTSFAIHSDGRLIILDGAGNQTVRQQM